jgi:hypothetical protein
LISSVSIVLRSLVALLAVPTIFSPETNEPEITETSRTLVIELHVFTLAVVPLTDPVTISLKT